MRAPPGQGPPVELPLELSEGDLRDLGGVLESAGISRRDTVRNLTGYCAAAAECDESPLGVTQIAARAPTFVSNPMRAFRRLVTDGGFDEEQLVDYLLAAVPQVQLLRLECEEGHVGSTSWEHVSIHAVVDDDSTPLDWRRVKCDSDDYDLDVVRAVTELVGRALGHYRARGLPAPPIVSTTPSLGEWRDLRAAIAEHTDTYAMAVSEHYSPRVANHNLYAQRNPDARAADLFQTWPAGNPPRPLRIVGAGPTGEYLTPIDTDSDPMFAVVRAPAPAGKGFRGRRLEQRAAAIGAPIGEMGVPSTAADLRIDAFKHSDDRAYRRHALLMSIVHAVVAARAGIGGREASTSSRAEETS